MELRFYSEYIAISLFRNSKILFFCGTRFETNPYLCFQKLMAVTFVTMSLFRTVNEINLNSTETEFEPSWWVHFWRNWNCSFEIHIKYMTQIKDMILRTLNYEWFIVEYHVLDLLKLNIIQAISCLSWQTFLLMNYILLAH